MAISTYSAIFLSVLAVTLVSLVGVLALAAKKEMLNKVLLSFVSLSAGTLLGGAFLHLLPEAVEEAGEFSVTVSIAILVGIIIFFLIDKLVHYKHHHSHSSVTHETKNSKKSIAYLNLFGDGVHNFLDGLVIAGAYLISFPAGVAATIAVVVHEVPQELADFGVLLYSGLSKARAIFLNLLSGAAAILGAALAIVLKDSAEGFHLFIIPFAAGAFIYIAGSNLIPELHAGGKTKKQVVLQTLLFLLGIGIMYALTFLEGAH